MNSLSLLLSSGIALTSVSAHPQSAFQNLDFESATPGPPITGPITGAPYQPVSLALPDWTALIGTDPQSEVLQNAYTEGQAAIDLFGPNYSAAGPSGDGPFNPGVIDGNYSVLLQAGGEPGNSTVTVGASIAQTGVVPAGSQLMEFRAWQTSSTQFTVSFDGTTLLPVALGAGANYTLYGVNISPYDGQSGQLEFTADFSNAGASWLGLDDITFTSVPEPNPIILAGIGGLSFGLYRRSALNRR